MKTKFTLSVLVLILSFFQLSGQDYHFSQYFNTPLLLNPALTGFFNGDQRAGIYYRNQWKRIMNPYVTYGFGGDARLLSNSRQTGYLSGGLSVMKDQAGESDFALTQVLFSVAYHQKISLGSVLTGGIQGGFGQRTINKENLIWGNQYDPNIDNFDLDKDPREPLINERFNQSDLSGGILYSFISEDSKMSSNDGFRMNIGASFYHFHKPKNSFTGEDFKMCSKFVVHGNSLIGIGQTNIAISPGFLYMVQGSSSQLLVGGLYRYMFREQSKYTRNIKESAMSLGCYYRMNDAVIPYVGIEFANFMLGVSYDTNISGLRRATKQVGGIEFNLSYINPNPFKQQSRSFY